MEVKDIENKILREMFGNDSKKFAGFNGIVDKLIESGSCVTTIQGKDINFFCMNSFVGTRKYDGGVDLIELYFDRNEVVGGAEFKRRLNFYQKTLAYDIVQVIDKLDALNNEYELVSVMTGEE